MKQTTIIAVDPGKTTGICVIAKSQGQDPDLLDTKELSCQDMAPYLRDLINKIKQDDFEIVCERFTINAQTVRNSQAPWSLEQIGILKQILRDFGLSEEIIHWQQPADAMNMFNNEKLKRLGYWHRGGEGHANDAARHALLRAVKTGWIPKNLLSN